jgi:putative transposase
MRFDHGRKFIAYAMADWCRFNATDTVFIDPGPFCRELGGADI